MSWRRWIREDGREVYALWFSLAFDGQALETVRFAERPVSCIVRRSSDLPLKLFSHRNIGSCSFAIGDTSKSGR